jgi:hypothetical protein
MNIPLLSQVNKPSGALGIPTANNNDVKKKCKSGGKEYFLNNAMINIILFAQFYVWGIAAGILAIIIWYISSQITQKERNINIMTALYKDNVLNQKQINSIFTGKNNDMNESFKLDLKDRVGSLADYMILSSYNSCCVGDFLDSYVSLDALKNVINQGARVLDFSIYLVDEDGTKKAVVGAAPDSSTNIKGTYNHLNLVKVFKTIQTTAMKSGKCTNWNDPLFIHLRIMSAQSEKLYKSLAEQFAEVWEEGDLQIYTKSETKQLGEVYLNELKNKVVIIISDPNVNHWRAKNETDWEGEEGKLVIGGNDKVKKFMRMVSSFSDYQHRSDHIVKINKANAESSDIKSIIDLTRKNIYIIIPDELSINDNMDYEKHHNMGCQMVCMNWQNLDGHLSSYIAKFRTQIIGESETQKAYAFMLKSKALRGKSVTVTQASKLADNTSTKPQKQQMYGTTMTL